MAVITGTAVLRVRIDSAGNVLTARGVSGHPILVKAAVENIKLWRFSTRGPAAAGAEFEFSYVFELKGASRAPVQCSTVTYEFPDRVTVVSKAPYVTP
jgi:outer membrane biosynthesis protein TonB